MIPRLNHQTKDAEIMRVAKKITDELYQSLEDMGELYGVDYERAIKGVIASAWCLGLKHGIEGERSWRKGK